MQRRHHTRQTDLLKLAPKGTWACSHDVRRPKHEERLISRPAVDHAMDAVLEELVFVDAGAAHVLRCVGASRAVEIFLCGAADSGHVRGLIVRWVIPEVSCPTLLQPHSAIIWLARGPILKCPIVIRMVEVEE